MISNSSWLLRLAVEELEHRDAGQVFLQIRVDAGDGDADAAIALRRAAPENHRDHDDARRDGEQQSGHRGAQVQHRDDHEGEHQQVAEDRDQAGGEQLVQSIDVGGDAGQHTAYRRTIVEGQVQALEMGHQIRAGGRA